jgi:nucleoid-associated protein YgaU
MAAVIIASPTSPAPHVPGGARRPDLRVIHGGRSAVNRGMQRVYLRRRLLAGLAVLLLATVMWMAVVGALSLLQGPASSSPTSAATAAVPPAAAEEYIVQPGDTLWTIAERLDPPGDLRPIVDELADRAGGAVLQSGQRIDVRGLAD